MYINIKDMLCYKAHFDENTEPVCLQFKSKIMCDLVVYDLDCKINLTDINFELKGNPIKFIASECSDIYIEDINVIDYLEIKNKLIEYILNNELKCSWYIFATSHRLYKKNKLYLV